MSSRFLPETEYPTIESAQDAHPNMTSIIEVDGGFMAFETADDEITWMAQE